ncbi:MAG: hypothetical protein ABMA14_21085 [Hyphomonadaceae bacterium]
MTKVFAILFAMAAVTLAGLLIWLAIEYDVFDFFPPEPCQSRPDEFCMVY